MVQLAKAGAVALLLAAVPTGTSGQTRPRCEPDHAVPTAPPTAPIERGWTWFASPSRVSEWAGYEDARLGVGHLRPSEPTDHRWDWPVYVAIPVWLRPNGPFAGWIAWGQLYEAGGSATALTGAGTVETGYESNSLYVLQRESDGWLQIRTTLPTADDDGLRWTHECDLSLGEQGLEYQSWEAVLTEQREHLYLRSSEPHALRSAPGAQSTLIGWIGDDHEIELLQVDGPWAHIRVREPDISCIGEIDAFAGTERTGWIRWFDHEKGPRLWYRTRGC